MDDLASAVGFCFLTVKLREQPRGEYIRLGQSGNRHVDKQNKGYKKSKMEDMCSYRMELEKVSGSCSFFT